MWPHQFTKDGKPTQIGVKEFNLPVHSTPMICVHCHARFVQGVDGKPPDPCPARNDKREMKRIKG